MSRVRSSASLFLVVLLAAAAIRVLAAEKYSFVSGWRTQAIRVDGNDEEWRPILEPVKDQHFSVAFLNDEDSLYFCLVTADTKAIRQINLMGLSVWLDPEGDSKKKKTFGVRYRGASGPRVEVLGPGRKEARFVDNGTGGVAARMDGRPDLLVYELMLPLRKTEATPRAPDVDAGAAMRVTLETPEWRGPLPPAGGGPVRAGIGVAGPHGGVFFPGPNTTLLRPIEVAGALRLAIAAEAPGR